MKINNISSKKQFILFVIIAAVALVLSYFKVKSSCLESLNCETSYCLKTKDEVATSCATKLMIIYSVPIVLGANLLSMGITSVWNKIANKKNNQ